MTTEFDWQAVDWPRVAAIVVACAGLTVVGVGVGAAIMGTAALGIFNCTGTLVPANGCADLHDSFVKLTAGFSIAGLIAFASGMIAAYKIRYGGLDG